ncbi:MAG: hypothetical protein CVU41_01490 [Chloroflexi bacterium HGW-Chloroflexi-3]|nr:MAG: hypothetical protein CVU41_01490 [Chloroflexi bacterium HGW-Chloroflexi-3]
MKFSNSSILKPKNISTAEILPIFFLAGRLLFYLALLPTDLHGMGDFPNYFSVTSLQGLPFFNYWTEYPPLFAFLIEVIHIISQGNQFLFDFYLYILITISGAISIWLFSKIASHLLTNPNDVVFTSFIYFGFLAFISYSWWYFELVVVSIILITIHLLMIKKEKSVGLWLGIGILAKWFPLLLFPAIFLFSEKKKFLKITLIAVGMVVFVWGCLYIFSPELTLASLKSQSSRNSWETIWALIDGNMVTGAFIPLENRLNPSLINQHYGNSAKIPVWLTFVFFSGVGIFLMKKIKNLNKKNMISFIGITWILFFLWSPGWSPQWILYLIPLILLTLPIHKGFLIVFLLSSISLLEWPVLLGRHIFQGLWILILFRLLIFIFLFTFWTGGLLKTVNALLRQTTNFEK